MYVINNLNIIEYKYQNLKMEAKYNRDKSFTALTNRIFIYIGSRHMKERKSAESLPHSLHQYLYYTHIT